MKKSESEELLRNYEEQKTILHLIDACMEGQAEAGHAASLSIDPFDKYEGATDLDKGGMKIVNQVYDKNSSRSIAMAKLQDDFNEVHHKNLFIREARLTALLEHPNIVPVHEVGVDSEGDPYFTMKLIEGETLEEILSKLKQGDDHYRNKYPLPVLLDIFLKICDAIAFAHSRGVIHLDLKPANIRVSGYGEVLVIDWGLAKFVDEYDDPEDELNILAQEFHTQTMYGAIKGTAGYMSPEQASANNKLKSRQTDVFALGAILYSILSHEVPFEGKDVEEVLSKTIAGELLRPSKRTPDNAIPMPVESICLKAMSKEIDDRYKTVAGLINDIQSYRHGYATIAEEADFITLSLLLIKRNKPLFTMIAISIIVLGIFGSYSFYQIKQSEREAIAAEQDAQDEKAKAEESEQQASSALAALKKEKAENLELSEAAAKDKYNSAIYGMRSKQEFDRSYEKLQTAVELNPKYKRAYTALALIDFAEYRFYNARLNFEKAEHKEMLKVLDHYQLGLTDTGEEIETIAFSKYMTLFKDFRAQLDPKNQHFYILEFLSNIDKNKYNTENLVRTFRSLTNNKTAFDKNVRLTTNKRFVIYHQKDRSFYETWMLPGLPVIELDMKEQSFNTGILPYMRYLRRAFFRKTNFKSLTQIKNSPVETLDIAYSQTTTFYNYHVKHLKTLNISGLNISKTDDLYRLAKLEEVIVDKDHSIFSKQKVIKQLEKNNIKLIVETD